MNLLKKEPDERYQSAQSPRADLKHLIECLTSTGALSEEFELGQGDVPERPIFPSILFGREQELAKIHAIFSQTVVGTAQLLLVSGAPGAGKSSLYGTLRALAASHSGYLVHGKFDHQRRDQAYSPFLQSFRALVDLWPTECPGSLERRKQDLQEFLGGLSEVMVELVPDLALLLPDAVPPPRLGPRETRARIGVTVRRFLLACTSQGCPLVLFLDDVQWADPGSRHLLAVLTSEPMASPALLLRTYRSGEDEANLRYIRTLVDSAKMPVHEIELAHLSDEALVQLPSVTLERSNDAVQPLAETIRRKIECLPLLVQQFVDWLHQRCYLDYDSSVGWRWSQAEIDAVEWVSARMATLDSERRAVLALASCIGDSFDLGALREVWTGEQADLEAPLPGLAVEAMELGELQVASFCRGSVAVTRIHSGVALPVVLTDLEHTMPDMRKTETWMLSLLIEGGDDPNRMALEIQAYQRLPRATFLGGAATWMLVLCVLGYEAQALDIPSNVSAEELENSCGAGRLAADLTLLRGLLLGAAQCNGTRGALRPTSRALKSLHARMLKWSKSGPDFAHMALLLEAERNLVLGKPRRAIRRYEQVAQAADQHGYLHHAAIAHGRCAFALRSLRRDMAATACLRTAVKRYQAWGAAAKVMQLTASIPD